MYKDVLIDKNMCLGCTACKHICPVSAIYMEENVEGFQYPKIDENTCINCDLCKKVCPIHSNLKKENINQEVYAAYSKNNQILINSTSGGMFTAFANEIIKQDGIVYGAAYCENLKVKHIRVTNIKDLPKLQGSKYIASALEDIYLSVEEDLKNRKAVLFSGTPCQIAGLKNYLRKEYDNLLTIDIICHGTPSQKLFDIWKKWKEDQLNAKIVNFEFRNKKKGWGLTYQYYLDNGKKKFGVCDRNEYYINFLNMNTYRESCYQCPFANIDRVGDITLGDYWGIQNYHPDMINKNGVSLLIINTDKGKQMFNDIKEKINYEKSTMFNAIQGNSNLVKPSKRPDKRENIYKGIDDKQYIQRKLKINYKKAILKSLFICLPYSIQIKLKQIIKIIMR